MQLQGLLQCGTQLGWEEGNWASEGSKHKLRIIMKEGVCVRPCMSGQADRTYIYILLTGCQLDLQLSIFQIYGMWTCI